MEDINSFYARYKRERLNAVDAFTPDNFGKEKSDKPKKGYDTTCKYYSILTLKEKKSYGQVPSCDLFVEFSEPVAAEKELEEQLDWEPPEPVDKTYSNMPSRLWIIICADSLGPASLTFG